MSTGPRQVETSIMMKSMLEAVVNRVFGRLSTTQDPHVRTVWDCPLVQAIQCLDFKVSASMIIRYWVRQYQRI